MKKRVPTQRQEKEVRIRNGSPANLRKPTGEEASEYISGLPHVYSFLSQAIPLPGVLLRGVERHGHERDI